MNWNDFLNPRSMLTPGVAGSLVMVVANTLWVQFMVPPKWSALVLSFLLIIPILLKFSATFVESIVYFIFNGLIIFSLAANANFAGRKLQEISAEQRPILTQQVSTQLLTATISALNSETKIKPSHDLQLASNDDRALVLSDSTHSGSKPTEKKSSDQKGKDKGKQSTKRDGGDRQFFGKWF